MKKLLILPLAVTAIALALSGCSTINSYTQDYIGGTDQRAVAKSLCTVGVKYIDTQATKDRFSNSALKKGVTELQAIDNLDPSVAGVLHAVEPIVDGNTALNEAKRTAQRQALTAACDQL